MKIALSQQALNKIIVRGGAAAFTAEGQSEEQKASNITKSCIFIKAEDDSVLFESSVTKMGSRCLVKTGKGVEVSDKGEICVPAKELKELCSKLKENQDIILEFIPNASGQAPAASPYGIQSSGSVSVKVSDGDNEIVQASLEAYPTDRFERSAIKTEPVVLKGKNKLVKDAAAMVAFAINPSDYGELLNNIGVFVSENTIHFVGTDRKRCAISNLDRKLFEVVDFDSILLESEFLAKALDLFGEDNEINMSFVPDGTHVTLFSGDTCVRLDTVDKVRKAKYPDYRKVLKMGTKVKIIVDRKSLEFGLKAISLANKSRSFYTIKKDATSIGIKAKGVTAVRGIDAKAKCEKIEENLSSDTICFSTEALMGGVDKLSGDKVEIAFTADEMRAKIQSPENPSFIYLMQRVPDEEM